MPTTPEDVDFVSLGRSPAFHLGAHHVPPELKDEPWLVKSENTGPLSPITPHQLATPRTPFSLEETPLVSDGPQLSSASCPFASEQASSEAEAVLNSILSPPEGGTVEATLDDIALSDINTSGLGITAFNHFAPPPQRMRHTAMGDPSVGISSETALGVSAGEVILEPGINEFSFPSVNDTAPSATDALDFDLPGLGSTMISTRHDIMARAVMIAAHNVAGGSSEDRARPWACEQCSSRFSIKGHLSQHNRYVHEKYRPHCCPKIGCSASFGTRFARSQHIWTVHERKKPFACEMEGCKASFGQRSHLNRHRKRHRCASSTAPKTPSDSPVAVRKGGTAKTVSKSRTIAGGVANHVANHIFGHLPTPLGPGSRESKGYERV